MCRLRSLSVSRSVILEGRSEGVLVEELVLGRLRECRRHLVDLIHGRGCLVILELVSRVLPWELFSLGWASGMGEYCSTRRTDIIIISVLILYLLPYLGLFLICNLTFKCLNNAVSSWHFRRIEILSCISWFEYFLLQPFHVCKDLGVVVRRHTILRIHRLRHRLQALPNVCIELLNCSFVASKFIPDVVLPDSQVRLKRVHVLVQGHYLTVEGSDQTLRHLYSNLPHVHVKFPLVFDSELHLVLHLPLEFANHLLQLCVDLHGLVPSRN